MVVSMGKPPPRDLGRCGRSWSRQIGGRPTQEDRVNLAGEVQLESVIWKKFARRAVTARPSLRQPAPGSHAVRFCSWLTWGQDNPETDDVVPAARAADVVAER